METCPHHDEMMKKLEDQQVAIEGKISKGTLKFLATLFGGPMVLGLLGLIAFVAVADYKFSSKETTAINSSAIKLLDERTVGIKNEVTQTKIDLTSKIYDMKKDITDDMIEIKRELRILTREKTSDNGKKKSGYGGDQ